MDIEIDTDNKSWLNSRVAITVLLLTVFMALCKIKDDNIVQAMQVAKADAVDTWGEYQAKRLKVYVEELAIEQAKLAAAQGNPAAAAMQDKHIAKIAELKHDTQQLMDKARGLEKHYDELGYRDDQFDLSDAMLSIALGVAAVAALTERRWLLYVSWLFGSGGVVFGIAGFAEWGLHPDWIIKFLT